MRGFLCVIALLSIVCANAFAQTTLRFREGGSVNLRALRINGEDYCPVSALKSALLKNKFPIEFVALPGSFFIVVKNTASPTTLQMSLPALADGSGETLVPLAPALLALENANLLKLQFSRDVAVISNPNDREWERLVREETFLPNAPSEPAQTANTLTKKENERVNANIAPSAPRSTQIISDPIIQYIRPNSFNLPSDLIRKELESEHIIK